MAEPTPDLDIRRPFSREQARAAGLSLRTLRGPRFRRIVYDRYVAADVAGTPRTRALAALSVSPPGSYASHSTAAEVLGLWVPHDPVIHVSVPDGVGRTSRRGICAHRAPAAARTVEAGGVAVSDPRQLFLEMATALPLVDLVVLGDCMVREELVEGPEVLVAEAAAHTGPGARLARRAAGLVRAGVDSPMESRLRMLVVLAGLPEPVVNRTVVVRGGARRYRLDLSWPEVLVTLEYEGRHHAESTTQWQHDLTRREDLDADGWRSLIARAPDLFDHPAQTIDRVARVLRERGLLARTWVRDDEWRRHFPGRPGA